MQKNGRCILVAKTESSVSCVCGSATVAESILSEQ